MTIVYEDAHVCVIDKPADMTVNRSQTSPDGTVADWFEKTYPDAFTHLDESEESMIFRARSGVAHRLDKDTSGALLLAKHPQALINLMAQFKERKVDKGYLALVHGWLDPQVGIVRLPLARDPSNRMRFTTLVDGKMTETRYQVVGRYTHPDHGKMSLVALQPKTGRTHQLRVIMKHLGHPIVGDSLYTSRRLYSADKQLLPRQFLHAQYLKCTHPIDERELEVTVPLPPDCQLVLEQLSRE